MSTYAPNHPSVISIFVLTSDLSKYHLSLTIYQFVISPSVICLVSLSLVSVSLSLHPPLSVISVSIICLVSLSLVSSLSLCPSVLSVSVSICTICHLPTHRLSSISVSGLHLSSLSLCPSVLSVVSPPVTYYLYPLSLSPVFLYIYLCVFLSVHFCIGYSSVFLSLHPQCCRT